MNDTFQEQHRTGPNSVECLGQTSPSDQARREHFLKLLAEKLKNSEFRKIESFPIGSDKDILTLSDPTYYTTCPNPWLADFVHYCGKPYDSTANYSQEPFSLDIVEGKNHALYKAHSYHTKCLIWPSLRPSCTTPSRAISCSTVLPVRA